MFSDRSNWNLSPNSLSALLQNKTSKGDTIFDLTVSNPTRVGLEYNTEEILAALSQPQSMIYETDHNILPGCWRASGFGFHLFDSFHQRSLFDPFQGARESR
jgi:hypothetical protein